MTSPTDEPQARARAWLDDLPHDLYPDGPPGKYHIAPSLVRDLLDALGAAEEQNTQLACRVQDAWKRAEDVEQFLAAMTAVARRLNRGESACEGFWYSGEDRAPDYLITDPERRALEALELDT